MGKQELIERPSFVKDKHLEFLDALRESGVTNMYGAAPYVKSAFRMSRENASKTVAYWMRTFSQRHVLQSATGSPEDAR